MTTIAIAGAGVLGRLLAWRLARAGHAVRVFDPAPGPLAPSLGVIAPGTPSAAGFTAAGMLSPLAELDNADPDLAALGWRSIALWRDVAAALAPQPEALLREHGSLLLAHAADAGAAQRVLDRLHAAIGGRAWPADAPRPRRLSRAELQQTEPALLPGLNAWLLPGEAQVLPREMLQALAHDAPGVRWHWGTTVAQVRPHALELVDGRRVDADLAIDVRGLGARTGAQPAQDEPGGRAALRGVRGEVVWLQAPGALLRRPVRLLHPRHRVYVVPRPNGHVVIGASEIESEDRSPVSLRSAVELMAAAHSVLPELAEARIVHLEVNLRPAWPDHRPRVELVPGLLRITGLFRHGWLLAPALVDDALALWARGPAASSPAAPAGTGATRRDPPPPAARPATRAGGVATEHPRP